MHELEYTNLNTKIKNEGRMARTDPIYVKKQFFEGHCFIKINAFHLTTQFNALVRGGNLGKGCVFKYYQWAEQQQQQQQQQQ